MRWLDSAPAKRQFQNRRRESMGLAASFAVRSREFAVQVQHLLASAAFVEIINVLCHERECRNKLCHRSDRQMRSIRLRTQDGHSTPFVPAPHQRRTRRDADGVASSAASKFSHRPVCLSRKVGIPLSADTPAPARTTTRVAFRKASITDASMLISRNWKLWRVDGTGLTWGQINAYVDTCTKGIDTLSLLVRQTSFDFEGC